MIGEKALLELIQGAIKKDFVSSEFLASLKNSIEVKLQPEGK